MYPTVSEMVQQWFPYSDVGDIEEEEYVGEGEEGEEDEIDGKREITYQVRPVHFFCAECDSKSSLSV